MAAPNYDATVNDITANLKTVEEGGPRSNTALTIRALLLRTVKWISDVYDACASYGSFYAVDGTMTGNRTVNVNNKRVKFTNVNGWQVDGTGYWAVITTDTTAPATNYIQLLSLPTTSGLTMDVVVLDVVMGGWNANLRQRLTVYMSNREGFSYRYNVEGPTVPSRIEAYQTPDGVTRVYAVLSNQFQMVKASVPFSYQTTLVDSLVASGAVPAGTKVFDSSKPAQWVPNLLINESVFRVPKTLQVPSFSLPIRSDSFENRFGGLLSNYLAGIVANGKGSVATTGTTGTVTYPSGVTAMTEGFSDCQILGGANGGLAVMYYSIPGGLPNPSNYYRFFINTRVLPAGAITRIQLNVFNSAGVESAVHEDLAPTFHVNQWSIELLLPVTMPIKGVKFIFNISPNADIRFYEVGVYNNNMTFGENVIPYLIRDNLFTSHQQIGTINNPKDISVYGALKGYLGGALQSWKIGAAKSTSGATLKTTEYVEVEINGVIKKLAVIN